MRGYFTDWSSSVIDKVSVRLANGQSIEEIAEALDRSVPSIAGLIKKLKAEGVGLSSRDRDEVEDENLQRCPKCCLLLPHEGCLEGIDYYAAQRRGESGG